MRCRFVIIVVLWEFLIFFLTYEMYVPLVDEYVFRNIFDKRQHFEKKLTKIWVKMRGFFCCPFLFSAKHIYIRTSTTIGKSLTTWKDKLWMLFVAYKVQKNWITHAHILCKTSVRLFLLLMFLCQVFANFSGGFISIPLQEILKLIKIFLLCSLTVSFSLEIFNNKLLTTKFTLYSIVNGISHSTILLYAWLKFFKIKLRKDLARRMWISYN